ncbi:MAG: DUF3575 domain-containing protein [Bacteroides sp.]|nr:DUF3575 domain-containing protein [Bacteroides sp.]
MKRGSATILLLLFLFCALRAQVALKTNVPMDVLRMPNLGVEAGVSKRLTLDLTGYYTPWKFSDTKMHKLLMVQPELRYWFCDKFNGHFLGLHLMGGVYNTMGFKPPFGLWDDMDEYRYKGQFYGAGLSYGYQFILDRHWNLEATLGLGYNYVTYRKYVCKDCGRQIEKSHKNYVGPTKAALNLVYIF